MQPGLVEAVPAMSVGLGPDDLKDPSNPNYSMMDLKITVIALPPYLEQNSTMQCSQLPRLLNYAINSLQIVKMASNTELHCDADNIFELRFIFYVI